MKRRGGGIGRDRSGRDGRRKKGEGRQYINGGGFTPGWSHNLGLKDL
jgi:hypothetical protein